MRRLAATLLAVLTLCPAPLGAHPHGWIDIRSEVLADESGRIVGLRQAWVFDELYSAFMLDEFVAEGVGRDQGLARLLQEDVEALAPYDYFTRVEVDGDPQAFEAVRAYANGVASGRIWFRFELPLAEPVDPVGRDVRYAVFDPTYYIELLHHGDAPVRLAEPLAERCHVALIEPAPPAEIVSLAAMLDRTADGGDGLGAHFAQWVELRCARRP
jgi:ABC-type uncharacterized transport system substrate-binding protein